ncbi:TetR/AcrR family transcriptional regulator [Microbacterium sp. 1.5R]|uniref:TetR/AcrR family transcriptional regulator n=1 Tax=Microbacterium sp. 1.5R TaxID=1916917 RepID=UPI0021B37F8F|nr:TetR/AcrR family transcriptional regulator [Microbacterium sp. 1.5R]
MGADEASRTAGRPRDPGVETAILAAVQDLLVEDGYDGMTIAAVAERARCGRSAIYRRWETKAELVVAAVRALQVSTEVPDTGTLRGDLLAAALHFADPDERTATVLAGILSEIGRDAELRAVAYRVIGGPPVAALTTVIERWRDRGEVRPDAPVALVAGIVPTAAFGSVSLRRRALDPDAVTQLVDEVVLPALR